VCEKKIITKITFPEDKKKRKKSTRIVTFRRLKRLPKHVTRQTERKKKLGKADRRDLFSFLAPLCRTHSEADARADRTRR